MHTFRVYPLNAGGERDLPMGLVADTESAALREARLICPGGFELWKEERLIARNEKRAKPGDAVN